MREELLRQTAEEALLSNRRGWTRSRKIAQSRSARTEAREMHRNHAKDTGISRNIFTGKKEVAGNRPLKRWPRPILTKQCSLPGKLTLIAIVVAHTVTCGKQK